MQFSEKYIGDHISTALYKTKSTVMDSIFIPLINNYSTERDKCPFLRYLAKSCATCDTAFYDSGKNAAAMFDNAMFAA